MRLVAEHVFRHLGGPAISIRKGVDVPKVGDLLIADAPPGGGPWTVEEVLAATKGMGLKGDNIMLVLSGEGLPAAGQGLEVSSRMRPMDPEDAERLLDHIRLFEHCGKGLCMTPATRIASYSRNDVVVARWESCDRCGGPPVEELPEAELLRMASDLLRDAGMPGWWEAYSGALNSSTQQPIGVDELLAKLRMAHAQANARAPFRFEPQKQPPSGLPGQQ